MEQNVVLITGANSGIGRATALQFARRGWKVAATMRDTSKAGELSHTSNVHVYPLDVTDRQSVEDAFDATIRDLGAIDVVVNNAGYGLSGVFEAITDDSLQRQLETNVLGLMRVTRRAITHMRPRRKGVIVQISSMGGRITFPLFAPYHATKWAVEGFTESLHYELEQFNISMKLIEPGLIQTDFAGRSMEMITSSGTTDYDSYVSKFAKASEGALKDAVDANIVADAIIAAATDGTKRLRYPVGKPAPAMLRIRSLVSDSMFFKLIKKAYGM